MNRAGSLIRARSTWVLLALALALLLILAITQSLGGGPAAAASGGVNSARSEEETSIPAAENMSVLSEPQSASDAALSASERVRDEIAATVGEAPGVAEELLPGAEATGSLRALLTDLGSEGRSIWALVTAKGKVCAGLTNYSAGCIGKFTSPLEHVSYTYGRPFAGEAVIVWGLAPDDVTKVEVLVDGSPYEAQLGRNAFFYSLASTELDANSIGGLIVTLEDKSSIEIPFGSVPAPPTD
jgi:hypothetical protein